MMSRGGAPRGMSFHRGRASRGRGGIPPHFARGAKSYATMGSTFSTNNRENSTTKSLNNSDSGINNLGQINKDKQN